MKDVYTFKHVGYVENDEVYATSKITRILDDGDDISIFAVVNVFAEFLRACGFQEGSITKVLNIDEEELTKENITYDEMKIDW